MARVQVARVVVVGRAQQGAPEPGQCEDRPPAARREQAATIGDVLLRRTRLALLAGRELDAAGPAVQRVAAVLAAELGWDDGELRTQLSTWAAEARAEGVVGSA